MPKFVAENGFYTTEARSRNMSRIKGKNSKPEIALRKALWARGLRYRIHPKKVPGKPDIFFRKHSLAVFVDGEFWHGYDWLRRKAQIKSNREFWIAKIERNMQRDREVNSQLKEMGITTLRFWEGEVKKELESCVDKIINEIKNK